MKSWKVAVAAALVAVVAGAAVALPSIEQWLAGRIKTALEQGGQVSVASVEVGLLERRLTLHDLHSTRQGDFRARRWQASGLGVPFGDLLRGRLRLFAFRPGDPLHAGRVVLDDARFADGVTGGGWTVGSLAMEGVELDRYDAAATGPFQLPALLARVGLALSVNHLEETNATYNVPGFGVVIALDAMMVDRFDRGRIGKLAFIGLSSRPKGAEAPSVRMAEAGAGDLDFSGVLTALSSANWSPGKPLGSVSLEQASASGFSGESFTRYGLSLGSATLDTSHEGTDTHSRLRVGGFALAPPAERVETQELRAMLEAMKLKELRLDLDCAVAVDRPKGTFGIDRCQLVGADLGTLDFVARLVGADSALWQALERGDYFSLSRSRVALESARLALADKGILARALQAAAADQGQPVAQVRAGLAEQIRRYQPAGVLITDDLTKLLDTVARFIEQGGTLAIELKPDPPFALAGARALDRPGPDLVELLGASASHSR